LGADKWHSADREQWGHYKVEMDKWRWIYNPECISLPIWRELQQAEIGANLESQSRGQMQVLRMDAATQKNTDRQ
jgi:hypothetical protein